MATIKAIESRSVHHIQSGQVIVDLQSVCKELVENSIDAGATAIEVRFKNYGLDTIEVQDNGSGISPEDYQTIALKHYTSKLATYDDLTSLQTFGFRGEALSSLCALSKFHIITSRASDGPKGTRLDFEQSGKLKGTSVVAAKQGTTVVVDTLFHNLPVRRKELEKNIKREYNKVLQILNAYACISVGVKFSVSNQIPKGKKTIAFATNANSSTRDNISNVYGAKTVTALIPLNLEFIMDPSNRPGATQSIKVSDAQEDIASRTVKIVGHISRPVVGEGRQTPDRQMFFVNSRPCNLPQVSKAFNEVYKSYNITQSPFVFADIKLDTNAYDVNVSPDKRTIMLHDQAVLLENIKDSLLELFQGHEQSVPQSQLLKNKIPTSAFKPPTIQPRESTKSVQESDQSDSEDSDGDGVVIQESSKRVPTRDIPDVVNRPGFVKASLLERFPGHDSEDHTTRPPHSLARDSSLHNDEGHPFEAARPRSQSPLFEPEVNADNDAAAEHPQLPKAIQDFNARVASQNPRSVGLTRLSVSAEPDQQGEGAEQPVPAIKQTPQKPLSQSTIQNAFDRMRPMRTPVQQATITVGDTTTVSTIGTGSHSVASRRSRIHIPKSSSTKSLDQTPNKSLLKKGLGGFAAPGTQLKSSDEDADEDEDEDDEGEGHNNTTHMPIRSPSPVKRLLSRVLEGPHINNPTALSRASTDRSLSISDGPSDTEPVGVVEKEPGAAGGDSDDEYEDDTEKKAREEARFTKLIVEAEETAAQPSEMSLKRADKLFTGTQKKYWTINLRRVIKTNIESIARHAQHIQPSIDASRAEVDQTAILSTDAQSNGEEAEERLSLTVTKADFGKMRIIGQFNLGFIIAVRPPTSTSPNSHLFIIDQHASDEKYNFERLSATTKLVSQRLVHPHPLELTAVEEEIILANQSTLAANGFVVELNPTSDTEPQPGTRASLTSLPMSKEVTFTPSDLEELLSLILDNPPSSSTSSSSAYILRPSKVRKLLASRACRSSVMIGKTLKTQRMREIVRHMGGMDKPWSCPHGRPTMRHLLDLEKWVGWREGEGVVGVEVKGEKTDWGEYLSKSRG
ncbi:hypothetical protein COCVIDRAFT_37914 [Bipolaris victoriae FI3]|uniref:DNA mismatch repair protein PMS1 n=1 Tax=Bipolaris victoriae (strain FI3) TaxID=930091 RepID=W7EF41_BIPV3|nr:hypothetical protein COCVIDRAFT_37914 [Bipolaris victoriae FI3]